MITHLVSQSGIGAVERTPEEAREVVYGLEEHLKQFPQREIDVTHKFSDGLYYREILIPEGSAMTGRVHKQNDMNIVFYGTVDILTETGDMKRVVGPCSFTGKAGVKQFGIAVEDTLWATVHHTHLTDLDAIEKELFEDEDPMVDFKTGVALSHNLSDSGGAPCLQC